MSTRATYSFDHSNVENPIVFYVHFDNYPEGSAEYFWNMHHERQHKGRLAERFIKANSDVVEFTNSHEYHADTEYQYHVDTNGILTAKKDNGDVSPLDQKFNVFFTGHYAEFINLYGQGIDVLYPLECRPPYPFVASNSKVKSYLTLKEIEQEVLNHLQNVVICNYRQYRKDLSLWLKEYRRIKLLAKNSASKDSRNSRNSKDSKDSKVSRKAY